MAAGPCVGRRPHGAGGGRRKIRVRGCAGGCRQEVEATEADGTGLGARGARQGGREAKRENADVAVMKVEVGCRISFASRPVCVGPQSGALRGTGRDEHRV